MGRDRGHNIAAKSRQIRFAKYRKGLPAAALDGRPAHRQLGAAEVLIDRLPSRLVSLG